MKKVLIVYGTRYGSTEEISSKIVDTLKEKGIDTSAINSKDLITENQPNLEEYDGIIIIINIESFLISKNVSVFISIKFNNEFKLIELNIK